ncbi:glycosyltransferase family 39 protein [Thermomicrobium sp. 4228-Ro]|uniref:ArnT family glycosyltransferase n=1 Tax=Thermomicrobium sp. 4228-Ro TaxID=2993937 RepID=UPI002248810E|nr:glycosyltransferase family 39 protein [Thermomicrobium sp. 4228-Ro]MCX2728253.1 glycosyltransferase family 39 protein [Thermomicrobium sp. 4228-Ro]
MFAVALIVGALLRLWQLNLHGVNSDEAVYLGQAAALADEPMLSRFFPLFRAHPLLFPFVTSLTIPFVGYQGLDLVGRLLVVAFGLATVAVTFGTGRVLFGRWVGATAALFLALMPYHVVVTRQALLDGPLAFFVTLSLFALVHYGATRRSSWLLASGVALGLAVLTKETAVIFLGAMIVTLALHAELSSHSRHLVGALAAFACVVVLHPLTALLAGGSGTERTTQYLVWQLFRRPNHEWWFYLWTIPPALGLAIVGLAVIGLFAVRRVWSWRETLLVTWIVVPFAFFQVWPTKGFPYLVATAPAVAILAARTLGRLFALGSTQPGATLHSRPRWRRVAGVATTLLVAASLAFTTTTQLRAATNGTFLAGSGGVPGGREAGAWVGTHTPEGAQLLTIGPSMANILQFYGHRKAYGLSVSPNPLHRNPTYEPVVNPDLRLRNGEIQYIVWDAYSANRSTFFSEKLLTYARRYHGRVVHTESIRTVDAEGQPIDLPVMVIYEVRP